MAGGQHGVVSRGQPIELGLNPAAIAHRVERGRPHGLWRGVFAVGRPQVTQHGPLDGGRARVRVRRGSQSSDRRRAVGGLPRTPLERGLGAERPISPGRLEAAVNEADKLDLVDPETLRRALGALPCPPGSGALRDLLDRPSLTLTDSELKRRFPPIAARADRLLNGFRADFHWPGLGLVVETDGLRYHRTPAQQARDRRRDQAHAAAGLTTLRFTNSQVVFEPDDVLTILARVRRRLEKALRP